MNNRPSLDLNGKGCCTDPGWIHAKRYSRSPAYCSLRGSDSRWTKTNVKPVRNRAASAGPFANRLLSCVIQSPSDPRQRNVRSALTLDGKTETLKSFAAARRH